MVSYSSSGLKKLADTDAVALTAGVTRQHANSIQRGSVNVVTVANSTVTYPVTFDQPFEDTPSLGYGIATAVPANTSISHSALTPAGFMLHIHRNSSVSITATWVAVGKGSEL